MSVSSRRGECLPDDISRDWETMKTFTGSYANRQTRRTANGLKIQGIIADTVCVDIRTPRHCKEAALARSIVSPPFKP